MDEKRNRFRLQLLALGVIGMAATAVISSVSHMSIACGVTFGAGGWLLERFVGFKKFGGKLSSWLFAGGGIPVLLSMRTAIHDHTIGVAYYTIPIQYAATVFLCWGVLMIVAPARHEP